MEIHHRQRAHVRCHSVESLCHYRTDAPTTCWSRTNANHERISCVQLHERHVQRYRRTLVPSLALCKYFHDESIDYRRRSDPVQVDVRDVARAHVLSLTNSAASNKRILLVSGLITPQIVINIVRKNFPNLHNRVIEGNPSELLPKGIKPTDWDVARSYEIFGQDWKYIDIDKTVTDTVNDMLSHEKRWVSRAQSG
jgi:hypothetical protein